MKILLRPLLAVLPILVCFLLFPGITEARSYRTSYSDVFVRSYFRNDGTYVSSHYRSRPDGVISNNYSCIDNGRCGSIYTSSNYRSFSFNLPSTYTYNPLWVQYFEPVYNSGIPNFSSNSYSLNPPSASSPVTSYRYDPNCNQGFQRNYYTNKCEPVPKSSPFEWKVPTFKQSPFPSSSTTANYLENPFSSSLKINPNQSSLDKSDPSNVRVFEFQLEDKAPSPYEGTSFTHAPQEEIQVRRIRFNQVGSALDSDYSNLRLVNLDTGYTLQSIGNPSGNGFEFNLSVDSSKPDYGVLVSWHRYAVIGSVQLGSSRNLQTQISSDSNVNAYDYRNDARVATISKLNQFPLNGASINLSN